MMLFLSKNVPLFEKTRRNLKCILLSERSLSEKATNCIIPALCHSRKGKTIGTVKRSVVARGWEEGGKKR